MFVANSVGNKGGAKGQENDQSRKGGLETVCVISLMRLLRYSKQNKDKNMLTRKRKRKQKNNITYGNISLKTIATAIKTNSTR